MSGGQQFMTISNINKKFMWTNRHHAAHKSIENIFGIGAKFNSNPPITPTSFYVGGAYIRSKITAAAASFECDNVNTFLGAGPHNYGGTHNYGMGKNCYICGHQITSNHPWKSGVRNVNTCAPASTEDVFFGYECEHLFPVGALVNTFGLCLGSFFKHVLDITVFLQYKRIIEELFSRLYLNCHGLCNRIKAEFMIVYLLRSENGDKLCIMFDEICAHNFRAILWRLAFMGGRQQDWRKHLLLRRKNHPAEFLATLEWCSNTLYQPSGALLAAHKGVENIVKNWYNADQINVTRPYGVPDVPRHMSVTSLTYQLAGATTADIQHAKRVIDWIEDRVARFKHSVDSLQTEMNNIIGPGPGKSADSIKVVPSQYEIGKNITINTLNKKVFYRILEANQTRYAIVAAASGVMPGVQSIPTLLLKMNTAGTSPAPPASAPTFKDWLVNNANINTTGGGIDNRMLENKSKKLIHRGGSIDCLCNDWKEDGTTYALANHPGGFDIWSYEEDFGEYEDLVGRKIQALIADAMQFAPFLELYSKIIDFREVENLEEILKWTNVLYDGLEEIVAAEWQDNPRLNPPSQTWISDMAYYLQIFNQMDTDRNRKITILEMIQYLDSSDVVPGDVKVIVRHVKHTIEAETREFDKNGDGEIDFFEFRDAAKVFVARAAQQLSPKAHSQGVAGVAGVASDEKSAPGIYLSGGNKNIKKSKRKIKKRKTKKTRRKSRKMKSRRSNRKTKRTRRKGRKSRRRRSRRKI